MPGGRRTSRCSDAPTAFERSTRYPPWRTVEPDAAPCVGFTVPSSTFVLQRFEVTLWIHVWLTITGESNFPSHLHECDRERVDALTFHPNGSPSQRSG